VTGAAQAGPATLTDVVRLLAGAQKTAARGAPAYSLFVNRPLGRIPAALAYKLGWTPDMVTALSAGFSLAGVLVLALATPTFASGFTVWLLLAAGYVLDSADGQLARLRGGGSPAGEWLDHVVDAWKMVSVHLAVLVMLFRHPIGGDAWLLVPLGFAVVATVAFFAMILNDLLKAKYAGPTAPGGQSTPLRALLGLPTDYGVLCLAFVLLGAPAVFLAVYTALFAANLVYLTLALVKWFADMRALGSPDRPADRAGAGPRHRAEERGYGVAAG
jgi:phosphatidylglycerophosphate synthase